MPYDTPHAGGRPVLKFMIREPGIYLTDLLARPNCVLDTCEMTIVPDYTTGNEIVIWPVYALQLSLFASPLLALFIRRRYRRALRDEMRRQAEAPRQQVAEDFWQREVRQMRSQRKGETETKK